MIFYFIQTYGCQANAADSQGLASFLDDLGCKAASSESSADLILINTCAIRDKAEQKLWAYIGRLAPIKKERPWLKVGIIGCVASYRKQEIFKRFDHVTFVYGARENIKNLQEHLADLTLKIETKKQRMAMFGVSCVDESKSTSSSPEIARCAVNIMTGCNKYCAYCIVPFTRGREISFSMSDVLQMIRRDVALGAKEVTLIGQNVNSYKDPESGALFPILLQKVAQIPGDFWVRFTSPHPQDMTKDLFDVMAAHRPKIAASLHFPVQSGSSATLANMNRNYTREEYLEKIEWLRQRMPDATISTDIIVGFPGETEEDFLATMDLVEKVRFDNIFSFVYSRRKYTKAWDMEDPCPSHVKQERLTQLQTRQKTIAAEQNSRNIGKTLLCLVEKRLENGKLLARTEGNVRVLLDGPDEMIGSFINLTIKTAGPAQLIAEIPFFEISK